MPRKRPTATTSGVAKVLAKQGELRDKKLENLDPRLQGAVRQLDAAARKAGVKLPAPARTAIAANLPHLSQAEPRDRTVEPIFATKASDLFR